jgi:hypothetical protein
VSPSMRLVRCQIWESSSVLSRRALPGGTRPRHHAFLAMPAAAWARRSSIYLSAAQSRQRDAHTWQRTHPHSITRSMAQFMPATFQAVDNGTKALLDSFSFAHGAELKASGSLSPFKADGVVVALSLLVERCALWPRRAGGLRARRIRCDYYV